MRIDGKVNGYTPVESLISEMILFVGELTLFLGEWNYHMNMLKVK